MAPQWLVSVEMVFQKILDGISWCRCCDQFQHCRIPYLTSLVSVDCSQVIVCGTVFDVSQTNDAHTEWNPWYWWCLPGLVGLIVARARYVLLFLTKAVKRPLILGSVMSVSIPIAYESSCLVFLFIKFPTGNARERQEEDTTSLCTRMTTTVLSTQMLHSALSRRIHE